MSRNEKSSRILEHPVASSNIAREHFASRLAFETDASDVYTDLKNGIRGIIVLDARTPDAYARGHVPGSINLPYRNIDSSTTSSIPKDAVIVTYCDGVFCNASTKAAARLTSLGFRVKEMLDGMEGWRKEGFPVEESVLSITTS
jgi:rhodanese-related sulfurtransferase